MQPARAQRIFHPTDLQGASSTQPRGGKTGILRWQTSRYVPRCANHANHLLLECATYMSERTLRASVVALARLAINILANRPFQNTERQTTGLITSVNKPGRRRLTGNAITLSFAITTRFSPPRLRFLVFPTIHTMHPREIRADP